MKLQKHKDKLWVHYKGKIYSLDQKKKGRKSQQEDEVNDLIAPFSCKVLKIHVSAGQKVKQGDPVIVVEAMKMEYSYTSPRDGEILELLVVQGNIVQEGAHFVRWKK